MRVFATSVQQAADTFLHAGYISAQPPAMAMEYPTLTDTTHTGYAVSVEQAFRLADTAGAESAMSAGLVEMLGGAAPHLLGATGVAAGLWLLWRLSSRVVVPTRVPAMAAMMVGLWVFGACVTAPWEDIIPEDVADPDVYTTALLHSVVKEGISAHHFEDGTVDNLEAIAGHVALPVDQMSEDVQYVLDTYGLDGWGNEMELSIPEEDHYALTSAGADGEFDTDDDLVAEFDVSDMYELDRTYYLSQQGGTLWLFIRADGEASNSWQSDSLSGGEEGEYRFDERFYGIPLTEEYLTSGAESYGPGSHEGTDWEAVVAEIEAFYATFITGTDPNPVVVQVFAPSLQS